MKSTIFKVLAGVCAIAVVAGAVYYLPMQTQSTPNQPVPAVTPLVDSAQKVSESAAVEAAVEIVAEEAAEVAAQEPAQATESEVYVSKELGYKLVVPAKWKDYNYEVKYKYVPGNDENPVEYKEDIYTSDSFSDWPNYEIMVIGSMQSDIWYALLANWKEVEALGGEYAEPYNMPSYLMNKIAESGEGATGTVYYQYYSRQDAPGQFEKDGLPMPDMSKDFSVESK